jgi:hypothetical protein
VTLVQAGLNTVISLFFVLSAAGGESDGARARVPHQAVDIGMRIAVRA